MSPSVPELPELARELLKHFIVGLYNAGFITQTDCDLLIASLKLEKT